MIKPPQTESLVAALQLQKFKCYSVKVRKTFAEPNLFGKCNLAKVSATEKSFESIREREILRKVNFEPTFGKETFCCRLCDRQTFVGNFVGGRISLVCF